MEKHEGRLVFYWCCFVIGLTIGSVAALGSGESELELCESVGFRRYVSAAFVTGLPFWCCVFVPRTLAQKTVAGGCAAAVKGFAAGCTGVYIFSSVKRSAYFYALNILPQLFVGIPLLLIALALFPTPNDGKYNCSYILISLILSAATSFGIACVQFAIFFAFSQFN